MKDNAINDNGTFYHLIKIIFVGAVAVGKTNLITRYTIKSFNIESKPTLGVEFLLTTFNLAAHKNVLLFKNSQGKSFCCHT